MTSKVSRITLDASPNQDTRVRRRALFQDCDASGISPYMRLAYITEFLVREIIRTVLPSSGGRFLRYEERLVERCRELDVVLFATDGVTPLSFIEVKTNARNQTRKAARQVSKGVKVAQERWPHVTGAVLWVDTSSLLPQGDAVGSSQRAVSSMEAVLATIRHAPVKDGLRFRVELDDVLELGANLGLVAIPLDTLRSEAAESLARINAESMADLVAKAHAHEEEPECEPCTIVSLPIDHGSPDENDGIACGCSSLQSHCLSLV